MKKLLLFMLAALVALTFAACGGNSDTDPDVDVNNDTADESNAATEDPAEDISADTEDTAEDITEETLSLKGLFDTVIFLHEDTASSIRESSSVESYAEYLNEQIALHVKTYYDLDMFTQIRDMSYGIGNKKFFELYGFTEEIENCIECYGCYGDPTGNVDPYILYVFEGKEIDKTDTAADAAGRLAIELEEKLDDSLREYGYVIYPDDSGKVIVFVGP